MGKFEKGFVPRLRFPGFEESWAMEKLESKIDSIDAGWSPQCEEFPAAENEWGVLKTTAVVWEGFDENANKKLPHNLEPRPELQVSANDILITRAGPTSRVAVPVHVNKVRPKLMLSDKLIRLKTNEKNSSLFTSVLLGNSAAQQQLTNKSSGLAESQTNISQKILLDVQVSSPTLREQQKIAAFLSCINEKVRQLNMRKNLLEKYKKGMTQKIFEREVRFKDENGKRFGEWEEKTLGECLNYEQPTSYLVTSTEYSDDFETPVLTAGKTFILGYTDEVDGIYDKNLPVIIFDDFTTATQFVDFPFKAKSSAMKILNANEGVNIKYVYEAMQLIEHEIGGHGRHWISVFSNIPIPFPEIGEQTKIANFLSAIDDKINHVGKQIEKMESWKKGLLGEMFV